MICIYAPLQVLDTREGIPIGVAPARGVGSQVHRHSLLKIRPSVPRPIAPCAAVQPVRPLSTAQPIVAVSPVQDVVAVSPVQDVKVISPVQSVVAVSPNQPIRVPRTKDGLDALQRIALCVAPFPLPGRQVHRHPCRTVIVGGSITTFSTPQGIRTRPAMEEVMALAPLQHVRPAKTVQMIPLVRAGQNVVPVGPSQYRHPVLLPAASARRPKARL